MRPRRCPLHLQLRRRRGLCFTFPYPTAALVDYLTRGATVVTINVLPSGDWRVIVSEARASELEALGWAYPDRDGTWRLTMAGAEHLLALSEST